jgi:ATP-dependent Lon protease
MQDEENKDNKKEVQDELEVKPNSDSLGPLIAPDQVLPPNLFILPVNNPLVFPTLLAPIFITQPHFISMLEEVMNRQRIFGLLLTRSGEVTADLKSEDLYEYGVVVKVLKRLKMPDGSINLLIHSLKRFRVATVLSEKPFLVAQVEYLQDQVEKNDEMDALIRLAISFVKKLSEMNPFFTDEMKLALLNAPSSAVIADLIAFALTLPKKDAQDYLETLSVRDRFFKLLVHLKKEQELADIQKKISEDVNTKLNKLQRDFFLREQLKSIKKELGTEAENSDKVRKTFKERIVEAKMPQDAQKVAFEELEKLENTSEHSPEVNVIRNYLELLVSLPWEKTTVDDLDLKKARQVLDDGHYGLEKVKERIIEFLAVRKLKQVNRGSIICLVGPPGVGKTSIGRSIAKTMGREFFRFSLGGVRDEAEIKGHRRTYIGAMPGKIIQALKRCQTKNPVLMLDEIDKMAQGYAGDPAACLLEVLDFEQNNAFLDHYVDIPFDLSEVLFITTANTTASIPAALLDRMELIDISGYTLEEKKDIIKTFILPRELDEVGLKSSWFKTSPGLITTLVKEYAREPGLRSAQKAIRQICRKVAAQVVTAREKAEPQPNIMIREKDLLEYLGPAKFNFDPTEKVMLPGMAIGLAWTSLGGDILTFEAIVTPVTGSPSQGLKVTGQLGEVMTESANLAFSFVNRLVATHQKFKRELDSADKASAWMVHLHVPAGAIPKDGPSAGITMATALVSLFTRRKVRAKLAMTGELSLLGKVLPVGGIKEKLLAAHRSGITKVILPFGNKKDLYDVPDFVKDQLEIHFVKRLDEVLELALDGA